MAENLNDKVNQLSKHIIESTSELTELNVKVLNNINNIVQRDYLAEMNNLKKPEDIFALQLKVAANSGVELMSYIQQSGDIMTRYMEGLKEIVPTDFSKKPDRKR